MKKTKSMLTLIMAFLMVAGMVACGEEDENSSVVDNSDVISEIESKADTTTTTTAAESTESVESETEDGEWQSVGTLDFSFEVPNTLFQRAVSAENELTYNTLDNIDEGIQFISVNSIHYYNSEITFNLDSNKDWLSTSKKTILDSFGNMTNFKSIKNENESIDPNIEAMVIENEEEVEINGRKFIKCSGYIDSVEREDYDEANPFKCMFVGYLTVYQSDNLTNFKEPDLCSFFTFMKEDIADVEYMDKVALHAAETLKFEDE